MYVPYPFPYQGSKRKLAPLILSFFPDSIDTLIEPFAGAAAVSIAAAAGQKAKSFVLGDTNGPLIALWDMIINHPRELAHQYRRIWEGQRGREKAFYFEIRDQFNETHRPELLLFLLVRCVKASVRYNTQGEFNQGPDNRRKGTHPDRMMQQILATSAVLKGKTVAVAKDYREVIAAARTTDFVYLDPPYQGVCGTRDPRYFESLVFDSFVQSLRSLNRNGIRYIVSYDGRMGAKTYGKQLPPDLELRHIEVNAGRSSQATLLGTNSVTYESLYLSPALCAELDIRELHVSTASSAQQLKFPI